jgi:hypothetical protein
MLTGLWAAVALLLPIFLTAHLNTQLKLVEGQLSASLEQAKTMLQRSSAFYQSREKAYVELWTVASVVPAQLRQAAIDQSVRTSLATNLDKYNTMYRERSLYLTPDTEQELDRIYADAFAALGNRASIAVVESDLELLRRSMRSELQLQELEEAATSRRSPSAAERSK